MAESDEQQGGQDGSSSKGARRAVPSVQVIGWALILLILGGYFAWMIVEMGAHAVTHAWPMVGVLVAAVLAAIAATLGLLIGRRSGN